MASFIERVLILCKTYPSPSAKYAETSRVAGLTAGGRLVRLFPVPFRLVADDQQFRKWQWIEVRLEKARDDHRPESHRIFVDTIACDAEPMKAGKRGWPARMALLARQNVYTDYEAMEQARLTKGTTLALFEPDRIASRQVRLLEKIPFDFYYHCEYHTGDARHQSGSSSLIGKSVRSIATPAGNMAADGKHRSETSWRETCSRRT